MSFVDVWYAHWRAILYHLLLGLYLCVVSFAIWDWPRVPSIVLVWLAGGALLALPPFFRHYRSATLLSVLVIPALIAVNECAVRIQRYGWSAVARPHLYRPDPGRFQEEFSHEAVREEGRQLTVLVPDYRGWLKGALVETNSDGYRERERVERSATEGPRIVVLGNSFTMAWGVPADEAFPRILERLLADQWGPRPPTVYNLGIPNDRLIALVGRLETDAVRYEPDLVIVGITQSLVAPQPTAQEFRRGERAASASSPPRGAAIRERLGELLARAIRNERLSDRRRENRLSWLHHHLFVVHSSPPLAPLEGILTRLGLPPAPQVRGEPDFRTETTRASLRRLRRLAEENGCGLLIAMLRTVRFDGDPTTRQVHDSVRAVCEEEGIPFVDTIDAFPADATTRDYILYPGDSHPNARAQEAYARAIALYLLSDDGRSLLAAPRSR